MPTYDFRCPDGHTTERFFRKVSDAPERIDCPECGKPAERVVSGGAGLLFKGSGFYLTDYGKNAHRSGGGSGGSGSGDAKKSEGGAAGSGDAAKPSSGGDKGSGSGSSSGGAGKGE